MSPSIIIGTLGLLVEGEGMPPIMAPHNPSYYPALFSACGYRKDVDLLFYRSDPAAADPLEGQKLFRKCEEAGISFRCLDKRRLDEEMFRYVELHNRAYAHSQHYAHASATRREASFLGEAFKQIIEPEMIVFAERAGKTIGTCVAMPDAGPVLRALDGKPSMVRLLKALMAKHRLDGVRVADLAVDPAEQKSHVGLAMIHFVLQAAVRCGYKRAELGWVVENNIASMRCVELVKGRLVRRYRMYQKELSVA